MTRSAKLDGLGSLIERLRKEDPQKWEAGRFHNPPGDADDHRGIFVRAESKSRFDQREHRGTKPGNSQGIPQQPAGTQCYRLNEAGSEGVNLQVANVLANFDLPRNPMIVEQRIGRIQRLASEHASVGIFNMVLTGTFEEYIVGRLMEKLQLASHAIGLWRR